jgi:hypothetical protein
MSKSTPAAQTSQGFCPSDGTSPSRFARFKAFDAFFAALRSISGSDEQFITQLIYNSFLKFKSRFFDFILNIKQKLILIFIPMSAIYKGSL